MLPRRERSWLGRAGHVAELRLYAPYLVAEVVVEGGDMRSALSSGFRQVGGQCALETILLWRWCWC